MISDSQKLKLELWSLFDQNEVIKNVKFPQFTAYIKYLKENEEGVKYMSSILQEFREESSAEGRTENLVKDIQNIIKAGYSLEKACKLIGCTIEDYEDALKLL